MTPGPGSGHDCPAANVQKVVPSTVSAQKQPAFARQPNVNAPEQSVVPWQVTWQVPPVQTPVSAAQSDPSCTGVQTPVVRPQVVHSGQTAPVAQHWPVGTHAPRQSSCPGGQEQRFFLKGSGL